MTTAPKTMHASICSIMSVVCALQRKQHANENKFRPEVYKQTYWNMFYH